MSSLLVGEIINVLDIHRRINSTREREKKKKAENKCACDFSKWENVLDRIDILSEEEKHIIDCFSHVQFMIMNIRLDN